MRSRGQEVERSEIKKEGEKMSGFKELKVWQIGIDLVLKVYKITESFPKSEIYGLSSQMRRCAVSIPSNIAEGTSRRSNKEKLNFINIAYGSLMELVCQMEISYELKYITKEENDTIIQKTKNLSVKMSNYKNYLEKIEDNEKNSIVPPSL